MVRFHGRWAATALVGAMLASGAARAQGLNELGRVLQDQVLGGNRQDPNRERDAYERGRQDQAEQIRRDADRRRGFDRREVEDDRRRRDEDFRRGRDMERQRADRERALADERRAQDQSRRY